MDPLDPIQLDHECRIRRWEEVRASIEERSGDGRHAIWQAHIEQNLAAMSGKLNGLIGKQHS
jgi:hypothetical protein